MSIQPCAAVPRLPGDLDTGPFLAAGCGGRAPGKADTQSPAAIVVAPRGHSGYTMARMHYDVMLAPEAVADLRGLSARERALAREAMERHLRYEPDRLARSRTKRLRGVSRPQYRLRAADLRIFYDVDGSTVEVLAIVSKAQASEW